MRRHFEANNQGVAFWFCLCMDYYYTDTERKGGLNSDGKNRLKKSEIWAYFFWQSIKKNLVIYEKDQFLLFSSLPYIFGLCRNHKWANFNSCQITITSKILKFVHAWFGFYYHFAGNEYPLNRPYLIQGLLKTLNIRQCLKNGRKNY